MLDCDLIRQYLLNEKIDFKENFSLASISYIKIGGNCSFFAYPGTTEKYIELLRFLKNKLISYFLVGNASNCLFSDRDIDKVFVSTKYLKGISFEDDSTIVRVEAGVLLPTFVRRVAALGKFGFEGLIGIPGTVGGAIYMNAGAYGCEISDNLLDITFLNDRGEISVISKKQCQFSYRTSIFQVNHCPIVFSRFKLKQGEEKRIEATLNKNITARLESQEIKFPNLGSIFKTNDIYSDLGKNNMIYSFFVKLIKKISILFPFQVNSILNVVTIYFFGLKKIKNSISNKTLNCIVNKGMLTFNDAIFFIKRISEISEEKIKLEIEIIE